MVVFLSFFTFWFSRLPPSVGKGRTRETFTVRLVSFLLSTLLGCRVCLTKTNGEKDGASRAESVVDWDLSLSPFLSLSAYIIRKK